MSLNSRAPRSNCPLRMRCINSMPEIVVAALLNRLKPRITFVLVIRFARYVHPHDAPFLFCFSPERRLGL